MRTMLLLGASGSIGGQVLDCLKKYKELDYELVGITVGHQAHKIEEIIKDFPSIKYVYAINEEDILPLKSKYKKIHFYYGYYGLSDIIDDSKPEATINALVGFVGVVPSFDALEYSKTLYLANKETLVVAGDLLKAKLVDKNAKLFPIDSEHVGVEKCLEGKKIEDIRKIFITCSGGPFIDRDIDSLTNVTSTDALKHPTWVMGKKISIDSATLINKVFEIVEAHHLFDVPYEKIGVIFHKESLIHAAVMFNDGSIISDIGINDMRNPILYAISNNRRLHIEETLNFDELADFHFVKADEKRKELLAIAKIIIDQKGNVGAIVNAANDVAVNAFLKDEISFLGIYKLINKAISTIKYIENPDINDIVSTSEITMSFIKDEIIRGKY